MKKHYTKIFLIGFILLLSLELIATCSSCLEKASITKDENTANNFIAENFNEISVMPSYKYLGIQDFSDERVTRNYHIWKEDYSGNCVLLYYVAMKKGSFPDDVQWIDKENSIYYNDMKAVYTYVTGKALLALENLNIILPDCYLLAQEIHLRKDTNQVVFRMLLIADDRCSENYNKALEELDRVAIINNY